MPAAWQNDEHFALNLVSMHIEAPPICVQALHGHIVWIDPAEDRAGRLLPLGVIAECEKNRLKVRCLGALGNSVPAAVCSSDG
jgi:hypothetical protein